MKRVLVLSHTTGYQLRAFNEAAERLGIALMFATDRCHKLDDPWQDHAVAVRFHDLESSVKAIVARSRQAPIHGVIAVGDRPVVLAAHAADALGLPWHSVAGADASTDKRHSRAVLAAAGLPAPRFAVISTASTISRPPSAILRPPSFDRPPSSVLRFPSSDRPPTSDLRPPISDLRSSTSDLRSPTSVLRPPYVLKPVGLSGSRGVIRVNDLRELDEAYERIRALLARPQIRAARAGLEDEILVEQYIDGAEYAVEGVLTRGVLQVFAVFDKPDPLVGPFFEETIYVTPSALDQAMQARIADHVQRATSALGLRHGPVHAECRVTPEGDIYVLEVAARPIGGLCSRVLAFDERGTPRTLEEVLLRHAVGEDVSGVAREGRAAAVMMIPIPQRGLLRGVSGEDPARETVGVTEIRITAKMGQLLEPLPEAGSYLGFIFARGETAAEAEAAVRAAHRRLVFDIAKEIPVV